MKKIKMDKSQITVFSVYFVLLVITSLLFLYPLFWAFINSFKPSMEYYDYPNSLPKSWDFSCYINIFQSFTSGATDFFGMIWNSVWQVFGGQLLHILACACVAYPLARYKFPLHKFFFGIIIFRITIPIVGASAAAWKVIEAMNLYKSPLYLITYFNGFDINALILYGYFKTIDKGYSEAAYLDGASTLQVLLKIILPQCIPCMLALYINNVMGNWNVYATAQLYLPNYPNLALGIWEMQEKLPHDSNGPSIFFGSIILSSLVPITLFAVSQKTILQNMSVGGLKG